MSELNLHLKVTGGNIYAASTDVAAHFNRPHKDVLDSIALILKSPDRYFEKSLDVLENGVNEPNFRPIDPSNRRKISPIKFDFNAADYDILRQFVADNHYQETTYLDERGRTQRAYLMDRDGFVLLAMSFTTLPAMVWKIRYLSAFNAMEQRLTAQHAQAQQALLFPIWIRTPNAKPQH